MAKFEEIKNGVIFPIGAQNDAYAQYFIGQSYLEMLAAAPEGSVNVGNVTFGDVVVIKEGVKHWHGAAKDSWFAHLAITAGSSEWCEPVTDQEYEQLEK
ncbi:cupin domain-containing protein [Erwinia sp. CPCC 100877]|nr:cupin domain-containing protein [Erwinia sp. CPCC 100877]